MAVHPEGWRAGYAGHHWLEKRGRDGRFISLVVLEWTPASQSWWVSGMVGEEKGKVDMSKHIYNYICHIETPELSASIVKGELK